jgi:hypothetical protein
VAFRQQEVQENCDVCSKLTTSRCLRCGTPLCQEHVPATDKERCTTCQADLEVALDLIERRPRFLKVCKYGFALGVLGVVLESLITRHHYYFSWSLAGVVLISICAPAYLIARLAEYYDTKAVHQFFLKERKHQVLPGEEPKQLGE